MEKALEEYVANVLQPTTPEMWVESYPTMLVGTENPQAAETQQVIETASSTEDVTTKTRKRKKGLKTNTSM